MEEPEEDLPGYEEMLAMVKQGTYDVPHLATTLGITESHVRLLLSTIAEDDLSGGRERALAEMAAEKEVLGPLDWETPDCE